jgi:hypothetical protein
MAQMNLDAGLRSLRESLRQMKALLAWEQLKKAEARPGRSSVLTAYDPTEVDLRGEYSFFLATSVQIHHILDDSTIRIPVVKRQAFKLRLARVQQEMDSLDLHQRFCIH